MPRSATYEDVVRLLTGCEFDSSSIYLFLRLTSTILQILYFILELNMFLVFENRAAFS